MSPNGANDVAGLRRLDLRLLVPVLLTWPVLAFWSLPGTSTATGAGAAAAGLGSVLLLHSSRSRRRSRLPALTLACLTLLLLTTAGHLALRGIGPLSQLAQQRAVVTVVATLTTDPRMVTGPGQGRGGQPLVVTTLAVHEVSARGRTTVVDGAVLVLGGPEWVKLRWRDEVKAVLRLAPAQAADQQVALATPKGKVDVLGSAGGVFAGADFVRDRFRAATDGLPPDARGLVPALVIGDTTRTPAELTAAMLVTGMSHLSAVSGSNVTLVLVAATALARLLGVGRRWRPWAAALALTGFVVLARPEPSVIRAAVMGSIGLLALSASRRQMGVPALSAAIVLLLAWDPWLSRSYGFALSAVATLGLLVFAGPWGRAIGRVLPRRLAGIGPVLAVPLAAQAVCAPIVVPLQGTVSLIAVVANLLAAPLVAPTTVVGVVVALGSVGWVAGAAALAWLAALPALGIAAVARWCADVPMGSIAWGESATAAAALAAVTALLVLASPWLWFRLRRQPLLVVSIASGAIALTASTTPLSWPPPGWIMVVCDVGQGDAIVVNTGSGHAVVVDTGPEPKAVDGCLDRLGVTALDLVVLTHFHADHVRGLEGVLAGRSVAEIRVSPVREPRAEADRVARLAAAAGVDVRLLRAGDDLRVATLSAHVWWPAREIDAGSVPNNGSVVMSLHVSGVGILLSGDIEREAAAEVVRAAARDSADWVGIDVVKVAHHGSSNRDDRTLDGIRGRLALISVGAGNDYGHPAPSTLTSLLERGFEVHRTDLEGDLAVVTGGRGAPLRVVTP